MDKLSEIAKFFDCEKYTICNFTPYYNALFEQYRDKAFNLFEIGVFRGDSIRMWEEYFPKATIYAIDTCSLFCRETSARSHIYCINQCDKPKLTELMEYIGNCFIICDDGSHMGSDIADSLEVCYPFLENGGYYIIEDILPEYRKQVEDCIDKSGAERILYKSQERTPKNGMWILQKPL